MEHLGGFNEARLQSVAGNQADNAGGSDDATTSERFFAKGEFDSVPSN